MRLVVAVALLALLAGQTGAAGDVLQVEVVRDLFVAPPLEAFAFQGGCGVEGARSTSGSFQLDSGNRSFRFTENSQAGAEPADGVDVIPDGEFQTSCGWARLEVQVPSGTKHIHVRFQAQRDVEDLTGGRQDPNAVQELHAHVRGVPLYVAPYVAPAEGSRSLESYDPPPIVLPGTGDPLELSWYFADDGQGLQQDVNNVASTHAFSATIVAPELEFSGIPVPFTHRTETRFTPDVAPGSHRVTAQVSHFDLSRGPGHLRFVFAPGAVPLSLQMVDGRTVHTFPEVETLDSADPGGPVLHRGDTQDMVVIPARLLAETGAGAYVLVLASEAPAASVPAIAWGGSSFLFLPLLFAVLAHGGISAYQAEAFGRFATSARALKAALWLVVAFYGAVVVGAWATGDLRLLSVDATRPEAILLYVQVVLATAAFLGLWAVGRHLRQITQPEETLQMRPEP